MIRYVTGLLLIVLSVACTKHSNQNYEITEVELARSGAWSDFGASISIDTSLNYKYYGDYGNVKQG